MSPTTPRRKYSLLRDERILYSQRHGPEHGVERALVAEYAWDKQQSHLLAVRDLPVPPSEALPRARDPDEPVSFAGARLVVTEWDGTRNSTWLDQQLV